MTKHLFIAVLVVCAFVAAAQEDAMTLDDLLQSAEQWAQENLDENALSALNQVDRKRVEQFLAEIEQQFHGEYIVDLAPLKDAARTILPLLQGYEETLPYALWLKTRMDYFDVADEFRL